MSDQSNAPDRKVLPQERTARHREPSMQEVAERIATTLGAMEDQVRIRQIVWDLGRTQAQALCTEALESEVVEGQTLANRFLTLVETKGVKKERPWLGQQSPSSEQAARVGEVTKLITEQLGEQEPGPRQTVSRSVQILGVEAALALLQQTHETEAAGGSLVPDGSRRRTPGGVYFLLVRQQASGAQRKQIFSYGGPKAAVPRPASAPQAASEQKKPQPLIPPLTWAERGQILDEAHQERGVATVKMTVIGRPGKIVERGTCVVLAMQQAAKIPALPAGLPLPPVDQVEATTYSVYISAKQWKKVAEAIKDEEDVLIVEGFPMLDREQGTIAVFASNTTTKKLQMAAKQAKV